MYSDEQYNGRNKLFSFLGRFILIAVFILLVLWLYPFPKNQPLPNLKTFYDDVFNRNIKTMRDAGINWYTVDKLPTKLDQTYRLTLQDMLDKKLLMNFTDKKGQYCDTLKSYIEVTKKSKDYLFKINLNCPASGQEDYILEYRGCYDVCKTCTTKTIQTTKIVKVVKKVGQTIIVKETNPDPSVETKTLSCASNIAKYGSTMLKITRHTNDPQFNYVIKVKQPGSWFYSTYASGTMTTKMTSISELIAGTSEGTLEYRVYINNNLHAAGDSNIDQCQPSIVKPKPEVTIEPNSCVINTNSLGSATFSIKRSNDDPQFKYTIKVKQPGGLFYQTVDEGIINTQNGQITKTVVGTKPGELHYQILIDDELYKSGSIDVNECKAPEPKPEVIVTPKTCVINTNSFGSLELSIKRNSNDPKFSYRIKVKQPGSLFYDTYYSGVVDTYNSIITHTINGTSAGRLYYEVYVNDAIYKTGDIDINQCQAPEPKPVVTATASSCAVEKSEYGSATISISKQTSDPNFDYVIKVKQPGAWFSDVVATGSLTNSNPNITKVVLGKAEGSLNYEVLINGQVYKTGNVNIDQCQAPEPKPVVTATASSCAVEKSEYGSATISISKQTSDPNFDYVIKVKQPGAWFSDVVATGSLTNSNPNIKKVVLGEAEGNLNYEVLINGQVYKTGTIVIDKCTAQEIDPQPNVYAGTNSCEALNETYANLVISINKRPEDPSFNYRIKIKQPNEIIYSEVANGALNDTTPFVSKTIKGNSEGVIWYQIFINDKLYKSGSESINKCQSSIEYEYLLKRENTSTYWTSWSNWQSTPVSASATRQVNTLDFYRGYKWISSLVYEYKHQRYVAAGYTEWGAWSAWSRTAQTSSNVKDVEVRTVQVKTAVGSSTKYGQWSDNPQKVIVSQKYYSIYNTGNSATATEYRQYLGPVSTNSCRNCYAYDIYTRSKTTETAYDYAGVKEYRYRTREVKTKLETIWTTSKSVSGWVYTGYARISENNGYYATTNWLSAADWNTLVADGYTLHEKYIYYTYSDLKTVSETEYKWYYQDHLDGWIYTGTKRVKETT